MKFRFCSAAVLAATVWLGLGELRLKPEATLSAQQPTFRTGVTLVTTDVIPRDAQGRFVNDLQRDNFTVLEDGQAQTISSFQMVHGGRTYNLLTPAPAGRAVPEGLVLPQSTKPRVDDTAGRAILIFIDDLHFEPEMSPHVRKLIQTIGDNLIHEGDMVMLVSSGPSFISIGPTYDKKMMMEAIGKVRGSGLIPMEIFRSLETSQGPADLRQRARMAFYTAYNMLNELEQVNNKRKAVIYISTGYDFDPFAEGRNSRDRIQGGRFSEPTRFLINQDNPYFSLGAVTADVDLHQLMRELTLSANRANATLYTIDPRGLQGVVDAGTYLDQSEWRTYIQKTTSTLRYMADATGGFAVVNTNDFATDLRRIDAETSDYYVIGFYSTNPDPMKRTRTLEVKLDRPSVSVAFRKEYSLKAEGKPPAPPALPAPKKK